MALKLKLNFLKKLGLFTILLVISFALSVIGKIKGERGMKVSKADAASCWNVQYTPPASSGIGSCSSGGCADCSSGGCADCGSSDCSGCSCAAGCGGCMDCGSACDCGGGGIGGGSCGNCGGGGCSCGGCL